MSPSDELRELLPELPPVLRVWLASLLAGDEPELTAAEWQALRPGLLAAIAGEREYQRAEACAAWHRDAYDRSSRRTGPYVTWATALFGSSLIGHQLGGSLVHGAVIGVTSLTLAAVAGAGVTSQYLRRRAHRRSGACVLWWHP